MNKDKKLEEAKKKIKQVIYTEKGEQCNYIDIDNSYGNDVMCEEFIKAIETVLQELENKKQEIKRLSIVRNEIDYGYEYTYLIPKDRIVIEKNKYLIEIEEGKFVDIKELYENSIPKKGIEDVKKKIEKAMNLANECIEERIVIADSDSLNFGRKQAHNYDIELLRELLKKKI